MLRLQETKKGLAQAALGEGGQVKLHKLSVKELKAVRPLINPPVPPQIPYHPVTVVWNESKRRLQSRPFAILGHILVSRIVFAVFNYVMNVHFSPRDGTDPGGGGLCSTFCHS